MIFCKAVFTTAVQLQ